MVATSPLFSVLRGRHFAEKWFRIALCVNRGFVYANAYFWRADARPRTLFGDPMASRMAPPARPRVPRIAPERPIASQSATDRISSSQCVPERSRAAHSAPHRPRAPQSVPDRLRSPQTAPDLPRSLQIASDFRVLAPLSKFIIFLLQNHQNSSI